MQHFLIEISVSWYMEHRIMLSQFVPHTQSDIEEYAVQHRFPATFSGQPPVMMASFLGLP